MQFNDVTQVQQFVKRLAQYNLEGMTYRLHEPNFATGNPDADLAEAYTILQEFDAARHFLGNSLHIPRAKNLKETMDMFAVMGMNDLRWVVSSRKHTNDPVPSFISSSKVIPSVPQTSSQSEAFSREEKLLEAYTAAIYRIMDLSDEMSAEDLERSLQKLNEWEKRLPASVTSTSSSGKTGISPKVQGLLRQAQKQGELVEKVLKKELAERVENKLDKKEKPQAKKRSSMAPSPAKPARKRGLLGF